MAEMIDYRLSYEWTRIQANAGALCPKDGEGCPGWFLDPMDGLHECGVHRGRPNPNMDWEECSDDYAEYSIATTKGEP